MTEEPHGFLVELGLDGGAELGLVVFLGHDGIEDHQGMGAATERTLRAAGGIGGIPWLKQRHIELHGSLPPSRFRTRINRDNILNSGSFSRA